MAVLLPSEAFTVNVSTDLTGCVVTWNVIELEPDGTVTDGGKVTPLGAFEELSDTTNPPVGANPSRVTLPLPAVPPKTVDGSNVIELSDVGLIVRGAVPVKPLDVAVIDAVDVALTPTVFIVKFAEVFPDGIVTVAGTLADEFPLDKFTTTPEAGALPFNVTVPVELFPPTTVPGIRARVERLG